ncbi:hypothetical protein [Caballeronia sp. LZ043]|uniref:hypothetical protein n=1 Tax=Caballeronia sp. LZ043 TaxID=3038569 RepID=UPI00286AA497|nr:hypothetical protein [Caballeronia sp. LZ043]
MRIAEALRHYGPPCGMTSARLVGYFEIGKHPEINMQNQEVLRDKVDLVFELSGPNCGPVVTTGGARLPYLVTIKETMSLNEKSNFYKLFTTMNAAHGGKARHMVQMLGKAFRMELFLHKIANGTATLAVPRGPNGYNIRGVTYQDEDTGETKTVVVDPAITELKAFVWDLASKAFWDSIYIPGEYPEVKNDKGEVITPKRPHNTIQNRIKAAANFSEIKDLVGE